MAEEVKKEIKVFDIYSDLHNICDKYNVIKISEIKTDIETEVHFKINFTSELDSESLKKFLDELYTYETELSKYKANVILLDLKGLSLKFIKEAVAISLKREDLCDPLMLLNILNLAKIFNTLSDSFFDNENIYTTNVMDFVDLRFKLKEELNEFSKTLSIYFLSLFKSYNKTTYTPQDKHKPLPKLYKNIIISSDLLTLSGIFSVSKPFSTDECIYIDDAIECLVILQNKSSLCNNLLNIFLEETKNDDNT